MSTPEKRPNNREITYRVGWKKGTIHVHDQSRSPAKVGRKNEWSNQNGSPAAATDKKPKQALHFIWMKAPYPTKTIALAYAAVLPVLAFAALLWLLYML